LDSSLVCCPGLSKPTGGVGGGRAAAAAQSRSSSLSDLSDNPLIFLKLRILPSVKRSSKINELEF